MSFDAYQALSRYRNLLAVRWARHSLQAQLEAEVRTLRAQIERAGYRLILRPSGWSIVKEEKR